MSISSNVSTRVFKPKTTNTISEITDGNSSPNPSFSNRGRSNGGGIPLGQKVITDILDRPKDDYHKIFMYIFLKKLLGRRHDG